MKHISIVMPIYRNESSLHEMYGQLAKFTKQYEDIYAWEFLFVDDGSDDGSVEILIELQEKDVRIKILRFSRNFGQVAAIVAGLKEASGDAVIIMSADLQDPIKKISEMLESWQAGNEIVICFRVERQEGLLSKVASSAFYKLMKNEFPNMPKGGFDYILLDRTAVDGLNQVGMRNRFLQGDILWMGFKVVFIPYERMDRHSGKSQASMKKRVKYFFDGVLGAAYWPIRLMLLTGMLAFFGGLVWAIGIFVFWLNGETLNGWAPIMVSILSLGGLNLLMIGILGEYIWRIFDETRDRPMYIIKDRLLKEEKPGLA